MLLTLVQLISRLSAILYIICGVGVFFSIRGLVIARREKGIAVFQLEREAALLRQRSSLTTMLLLTGLAAFTWINANILEPNLTDIEEIAEATPETDVFIEQPPTPTIALLLFPTITPTSQFADSDQPTRDPNINGCEIFGQTITFPEPGQGVSGQVPVEGTVNILGLAQYKFEVNGPATEGDWVVVATFTAATGVDGFLGNWDSTSLIPGDYTFRLVTLRSDGSYITPCEIPISIEGAIPTSEVPEDEEAIPDAVPIPEAGEASNEQ